MNDGLSKRVWKTNIIIHHHLHKHYLIPYFKCIIVAFFNCLNTKEAKTLKSKLYIHLPKEAEIIQKNVAYVNKQNLD